MPTTLMRAEPQTARANRKTAVGEADWVTLEALAVDPDACRIEASLAADERYRAAGPITRAFQVRPAD
jgi:hypothetical protein